jgi:hypothetical protein
MEERKEKKEKVTGDDIEKATLKPVTKAKSKEDKELQEWEVESTGGWTRCRGRRLTITIPSDVLLSHIE